MKRSFHNSLLVIFLLFPGQIHFIPFSEGSLADFGKQKEEWADLFRLSYQLLFYQSSLEDLVAEAKNEELKLFLGGVKNSLYDTQELSPGDTLLAASTFGTFKNEIDPLLETNLQSLGSHPKFKILERVVFPNIREDKSAFLNNLNSGQVTFIKYLPDELQQEYQEDLKTLRSSMTKKVIGGEYNYYLKLLRELGPAYESLLKDVGVGAETIGNAYIRIQAEEQRIELVYYFLEKYSSSNFAGFLENSAENLFRDIVRYRKILSVPKGLLKNQEIVEDELSAYLLRKNKEWYTLREKIIEELRTFELDVLSYVSKGVKGEWNDFVTNNPVVNKYKESLSEYVKDNSESDHEYIDIKQDPADLFWVRMRLPSGVLKTIQNNNGQLTGLKGELSLVYKPNIEDVDVKFYNNNKLFPETESTPKILESIRDLYVEVPLGLTVHDVIIETEWEAQKNPDYTAVLKSLDSTTKVRISYARQGIWTNFKYDYDQVNAFADEMQFPKAIGLNLVEVYIDPNTWDPELVFQWKPKGFLSEVLPSERTRLRVNLSEITLNEQDLKAALTNRLKNEVANKLEEELNAQKAHLASILFAESIQVGHVAFKQEVLQGSIMIQPIGYRTLLDATGNSADSLLPVKYRFYVDQKRPSFQVTLPRIRVPSLARELVKEKIKEMVYSLENDVSTQLREYILTNIYEGIQFSDIEFDIEKRTACGEIIFKELKDVKVPLCFDFSTSEFTYFGLVRVIENSLKKYIEDNVQKLVENQFQQATAFLCGQIPDFFGLKWTGAPEQNASRFIVTLDGGITKATLECNGNKLSLSVLDPTPELKRRLEARILTFLEGQDYLFKLEYPRFQNGNFAVDIALDSEQLDELAFLGLGKIKAGTVTISAKGEIGFNGINLGNVFNSAVKGALYTRLDDELNKVLFDVLPPKIDFDGIAMIRIKGVDSNLGDDRITISGEVDFESLGGFTLDGVKLTIHPSNLSIDFSAPDAKDILVNGIAGNFMSSFLEPGCSGSVGICETKFDPAKLELTGVIKINITGLITFPGIRFSLTPKKFDYTFNPQIVLYGVFPVGPEIAIIDPTLEFDFKNEEISGKTVITLGTNKDARATARVGKVISELNISLSNLGRIDAKGVLTLVQLFPVYYGEGYIDINAASFEMKQGTTGILDKIVHFEQKVGFYGKDDDAKKSGTFEGTGELDLLGMQARIIMNGAIQPFVASLNGKGVIKIPIAELEGTIGTKYLLNSPLSYPLYSQGSLRGVIEVAGFKLSSFQTEVNAKRVSTRFSILGARLGLSVPVLEALTEDKILDLILDMFEFTLDDFTELLNLMTDFDIELSIGSTNDAEGQEGEGSESGIGTKVKYYEPDENEEVDEDTGGDRRGSGNGVLISLNLDILRINHTTTRFEEQQQGEKCTHWDDLGICFKKEPNMVPVEITEESFRFNEWPNHWSCLPSRFRDYYAIYHTKDKHPISQQKVLDLVHPSIGSRIQTESSDGKVIPFFIRSPLEVSPISSNSQLCFSKEGQYLGDGPIPCVDISSIPSNITSKVKFYGNLGYQGDKVFIFTSAKLPESSDAFCTSTTRTQEFTVDSIISRQRDGESLMELQCLNCRVVTSNGQTRKDKVNLSGLHGYVKKRRVDKDDVRRSFGSVGVAYDLISDFGQIFGIDLNSEPDEYGDLQRKIAAFTKDPDDFPTGSLMLFDGDRMILANGKTSSFRLSIPQVNDQGVLDQFYELTSKVWLEVSQEEFLQLFSGYINTQDLSIGDAFDSLRRDNGKLLLKMGPSLDEFIQNWVYYGNDPKTIQVKTGSPTYEFVLWDYTKLPERDKNYTYTFSQLNSKNNPLNLSEENHFRLLLSDLTAGIGINSIPLDQHKILLEEQYRSHVYRNLLFFHAKDTLADRVLLSATSQMVVFGIKDSLEQAYRLVVIKPGANSIIDYREGIQLNTMGFLITSTEENINIELEKHKSFFQDVLDLLVTNKNAEAYIQQVRVQQSDNFTYRAVVFTGASAEIIWEQSPQTIQSGLSNRSYTTQKRQLTTGAIQGFNGKKIFLSPGASKANQAKTILSWFDGFDAWYPQKSKVNPASLLNGQYNEN